MFAILGAVIVGLLGLLLVGNGLVKIRVGLAYVPDYIGIVVGLLMVWWALPL